MTTRLLKIDQIDIGGGTQMRERLDDATIAEYAETYRDGGELDAITVYYDGSTYWLSDGFHRLFAAKTSGVKKITAIVERGTREDARWAACAANKHGLHRTNEDKRRAVVAALRHPNGAGMSDRAIAQHCGVGHPLVAKARGRQVESDSTCREPERRIGRDGKEYPSTRPANETQTEPDPTDEPANDPRDEWAAEADGVEAGPDPDPWPGDDNEPDAHDPPEVIATTETVAEYDGPVRSLIRKMGELESDFSALAESSVYTREFYDAIVAEDFRRRLEMAKHVIRHARPYAVCGDCHGKGCTECGSSGVVPRNRAEAQL